MAKDEAGELDLRFSAEEVAVIIEDIKAAAAGGGGVVTSNPNGFDPMEEDNQHQVMITEKNSWLDRDQEDNLVSVNDASIFYNNFRCMSSSSSSSSSTPPASKPILGTSSSSSATSSSPSWAMMRSEAEEDTARMSSQQLHDRVKLDVDAPMELPPPSDRDCLGDVDSIDLMENFGYMDLFDCNELCLWDTSSVFQSNNPREFLQGQAEQPVEGAEQGNGVICEEEKKDDFSFLQGNRELAMIFFEWLKQNRDSISAEDMRSIKLKRSTIESSSKRLGTSKEGKKQLLKLILEWVEQFQLQKKAQLREGFHIPNPNPNPDFVHKSDTNTAFPTTQWMPPAPPRHASEVSPMVAPISSFPPPMPCLNQGPMGHGVVNGIPYHHSSEYPMMGNAPPWAIPSFQVQSSQFSPCPDNGGIINRQQALFGNPYQIFGSTGERMMGLGSSATKEARKKRMARQRRLYSHNHSHYSNLDQQQNKSIDPNLVEGDEDCDQGNSPRNWTYRSTGGGASYPVAVNVPPAEAAQSNSGDQTSMQLRLTSADRRQQQGWKTEKKLKLLLQKVLKQSDVGNLGRIVLPKKEAESNLPELETRDGISITMEDIGSSRTWNMRYRFWPNNKSRMYLLENTGEFVRVNGLQEGDFIVIYSDTKCGKYMIRGVKVRQPGGKFEVKKTARRNLCTISSTAGNSSSLAPIRRPLK